MIIRSLLLNNFQSHKTSALHLQDAGLVLIRGRKIGSRMSDSNGSGKSTLLPDGVLYGLFGKTSRGLRGSDVINRKAKNRCLVNLSGMTDQGVEFDIYRPQAHPDYPKVSIRLGNDMCYGEDTVKSVINDTILAGIGYETFLAATVFSRNAKFFTQMDDDARKKILDEILNLTKLREFQNRAKERVNYYEIEARNLLQTTNLLVVKKEECSKRLKVAQENYQAELDRWNSDQAELDKEKQAVRQLMVKSEADGARVDEEIKLKKQQILELEAKSKELRELLSKLVNTKNKIDDRIEHLERQIGSLPEGSVCLTCTQTITKEQREKILNEFNNKQIYLNSILNTLQPHVKRIDSLASKYEQEVYEVRKQVNGLASICASYTLQFSVAADKLNLLEKQAKKANRIDVLKQDVLTATEDLECINKELANVQEKIYKNEADKKYQEFWLEGFGNAGIKSLLMDGVLPKLNQSAKIYSEILTEGELIVDFSTQTTLKSGATREKFNVNVSLAGDAGSYKSASGGEATRADLITSLALGDLATMRMGQGVNIAILDEVLDNGLDETGMERAYKLLQFLSKKRSSIFVVSHNATINTNYFPTVLTVEWRNGYSKLVEEHEDGVSE